MNIDLIKFDMMPWVIYNLTTTLIFSFIFFYKTILFYLKNNKNYIFYTDPTTPRYTSLANLDSRPSLTPIINVSSS